MYNPDGQMQPGSGPRQPEDHTRAIVGVGLAADAAAMINGAVDLSGVIDDAAASTPLDVARKADAATLVLRPRPHAYRRSATRHERKWRFIERLAGLKVS